MGCMGGCLTAPVRAVIRFAISVLKVPFRLIWFVLKFLWKLVTWPVRIFRH